MLKTITVKLWQRTAGTPDGFNRPTYTETAVDVPGVLVAPMTEQEITDTLNLTGRKAIYQLALPKGDANDWEDHRVTFFDEDWRVIGMPIEGIEGNIPLKGNKKVRVERYGERQSENA